MLENLLKNKMVQDSDKYIHRLENQLLVKIIFEKWFHLTGKSSFAFLTYKLSPFNISFVELQIW